MSTDFHRIKTTATEAYAHQLGEDGALFSKTVSFENRTNMDLTVIDRNNIPVCFPSNIAHYRGESEFTITSTYTFNSWEQVVSTINTMTKMKELFPEQDPSRALIYDLLGKAYNKNPRQPVTRIVIRRSIPVEEFQNHHTVYQQDTDYLVCNSSGLLKQVHPYSDEGIARSSTRELIAGKKLSGTLIEMIDNDNLIDDRYVYLGKRTVRIPAMKNPEKPSGVYVTHLEQTAYGETKQNTVRMSFQEAEETIGLYRTAEMAMTGGNPEEIIKAEEKRLQRELETSKREAEREAIEHGRDLVRSKAKLADLDRILEEKRKENQFLKEELEARGSSRKDFYEDRSFVRKDSHELIKYIPTIIGVGVAALAIFYKNK